MRHSLACNVRLRHFGIWRAGIGAVAILSAASLLAWVVAGLELWAADGTVHDHFIQMTEGVIAREELGRPLRVARGEVESASEHSLALAVALSDGSPGRVELGPGDRRHLHRLRVEGVHGDPGQQVRLALEEHHVLGRSRRDAVRGAFTDQGQELGDLPG